MSNQPLPQETQFSGATNMSNGEFQGKYIHFNVIPKSDDLDQWKVSAKNSTLPGTATPHETGLNQPHKHPPFDRQECEPLAHISYMATYPCPCPNIISDQECLQPHITSTPGQTPFLHQNQVQSYLQQSKDIPPADLVTHHLQ